MLEGEDLTLTGDFLVGVTYSTDGTSVGNRVRADGFLGATREGSSTQATAVFNKKTNDGQIVQFQKDGTTIGKIGSSAGTNDVCIYSQAGLQFTDGYSILPNRNGNLSDNIVDFGNASFRFDDMYATSGIVNTSDGNEKQDIEVLSEAEQRVAVACKGLLRKFRWKSAVEEKGEEARIHFGIIAQDLQAAFEAEGLDAGRYAMFISSTWTDEETGEEKTRLGVRYSELLAFIISAL